MELKNKQKFINSQARNTIDNVATLACILTLGAMMFCILSLNPKNQISLTNPFLLSLIICAVLFIAAASTLAVINACIDRETLKRGENYIHVTRSVHNYDKFNYVVLLVAALSFLSTAAFSGLLLQTNASLLTNNQFNYATPQVGFIVSFGVFALMLLIYAIRNMIAPVKSLHFSVLCNEQEFKQLSNASAVYDLLGKNDFDFHKANAITILNIQSVMPEERSLQNRVLNL